METTSSITPLSMPVDILFDMETQDPDDYFTLCFLLSHPHANLRAVTIYPGSKTQIGLIKHVLKILNRTDVLVGSNKPDHPKESVSPFHFKLFEFKNADPDDSATEVMNRTLQKYRNCVFFTGGPPNNLMDFFKAYPEAKLRRWNAQGGFAAPPVMPEHLVLNKFRGKTTMVSANFSKYNVIDFLLETKQIEERVLVAKNVCHGLVYDKAFHKRVEGVARKTPALQMLYDGMDIYLQKAVNGKIFHDPLACSVILEPSICEFKEVTMYHSRAEWGCTETPGSRTWIAISVDADLFFETLTRTQ